MIHWTGREAPGRASSQVRPRRRERRRVFRRVATTRPRELVPRRPPALLKVTIVVAVVAVALPVCDVDGSDGDPKVEKKNKRGRNNQGQNIRRGEEAGDNLGIQ